MVAVMAWFQVDRSEQWSWGGVRNSTAGVTWRSTQEYLLISRLRVERIAYATLPRTAYIEYNINRADKQVKIGCRLTQNVCGAILIAGVVVFIVE